MFQTWESGFSLNSISKKVIAAVDVHYMNNNSALAGAIVFADYTDIKGFRSYTKYISRVDDYVPGQFYKRELPCIMAILEIIEEEIDTVIIDGYVDLGVIPGLGKHLWNALGGKKKVIGVAKKYFHGSEAFKLIRHGSRRPLYITAAGIEPHTAVNFISGMHGKYRLPTLLKLADSLSKSGKIKKQNFEN